MRRVVKVDWRMTLVGVLVSIATGAEAADRPPPFSGRLDAVAVASRQVTIDGMVYSLSSAVKVQDSVGRLVNLTPASIGQSVLVEVAAAESGASGPMPILALTLIID